MIANALRDENEHNYVHQPDETHRACVRTLERLADRLADSLAKDNARFDRARFIAACKPDNATSDKR